MKKGIVLAICMFLILGIFAFSSDLPDIKALGLSTSIEDPVSFNTKEAKEIIKTVEKAYLIEIEAARSFDISKFPTVFINDPRFPVDPYTLQVVREMTNNLSLESAGWLDYKTAYYSWRSEAIVKEEALKAKAKAENRELTDDEKKSLVDAYGRTAPARPFGQPKKPHLTFISLDLNDDIAWVVLKDGTYTAELTLVLVEGKWYIAGFRGISVNI